MNFDWVVTKEALMEKRVLYFKADTFSQLKKLVDEGDLTKAVAGYAGKKIYWYDIRAIGISELFKAQVERAKEVEATITGYMMSNGMVHLGLVKSLLGLRGSVEQFGEPESLNKDSFEEVIFSLYSFEEGINITRYYFNNIVKDFEQIKKGLGDLESQD